MLLSQPTLITARSYFCNVRSSKTIELNHNGRTTYGDLHQKEVIYLTYRFTIYQAKLARVKEL